MIARNERSVSASAALGKQQLGAAEDHRERIVQLVGGSGGELGQGVQTLSEPCPAFVLSSGAVGLA